MFGVEEIGAQYTDDLWPLLQAEENVLREVLSEMEKFRLFTGLKIKIDKTSIMRMGDWPDMSQKI